MAGILGIYGMIVAVIMAQKSNNFSNIFKGFFRLKQSSEIVITISKDMPIYLQAYVAE